MFQENEQENCGERNELFSDGHILLDNVRKHNNYFEVVKVEDRGTNPCDVELPILKEDKFTEPMIPGDSELFSWGKFVSTISKVQKQRIWRVQNRYGYGRKL